MPFQDADCFLEPKKVAMHILTAPGVWTEWTGTLTVGDIEIGAVEIKNATTDDRAIVSATGMLTVHNTEDTTVAIATGNAAVAMAINPAVAFRLERVSIHLSAAGAAGNLTITQDAGAGGVYDTILLTQDMTSVVDYVWQPTRPYKFIATDHIDIVWANASTRTYGIQVIWSAV